MIMTKEEHDKIINFVNSEDYMLLNSYISKPYEETIIEQDKEIERLNNIIDELEKWLNKIINLTHNLDEKGTCKNVLYKLKELKEGKE